MVPRFFCALPLNTGQSVTLPAAAAHHAERVLRLRAGDEVVVFNGKGGEYAGRIETLGKVSRVRLESWHAVEREAPLAVTLVQALPAADKMDWIVQKAVELGVAEIAPVVSSRSVVRLSGERAVKRVEHLRQVALAACEQCGRNTVPVLRELQSLPAFLGEQATRQGVRLMLALRGELRIATLSPPSERVVLLVGPEGGLSEEEQRAAQSVGFAALALGPRTLRTDTAGIVALAALLSRWGDI
jgi:16S rRNA (uracil1498-N3)-methyltransferase